MHQSTLTMIWAVTKWIPSNLSHLTLSSCHPSTSSRAAPKKLWPLILLEASKAQGPNPKHNSFHLSKTQEALCRASLGQRMLSKISESRITTTRANSASAPRARPRSSRRRLRKSRSQCKRWSTRSPISIFDLRIIYI